MSQRGFTLWELLVTVLVVGVVLGLGVPNFNAFRRNSDMSSAVNSLVSALHLSRTEAVKRQLPVTLCGSSDPLGAAPACDGGTGGYISFVDVDDTDADGTPDGDTVFDAGEVLILVRDRPDQQVTSSVGPAGAIAVTYRSNGFIDNNLNPFTVVLYCDSRGNAAGPGGDSVARAVQVSRSGRPQLLRDQASITAAAAATGGSCP